MEFGEKIQLAENRPFPKARKLLWKNYLWLPYFRKYLCAWIGENTEFRNNRGQTLLSNLDFLPGSAWPSSLRNGIDKEIQETLINACIWLLEHLIYCFVCKHNVSNTKYWILRFGNSRLLTLKRVDLIFVVCI